MRDELNKAPQDPAELDSSDLEQVTGGAVSLNLGELDIIKKKNATSGGDVTPTGWDIAENKAS
jgi:hypothetical protein